MKNKESIVFIPEEFIAAKIYQIRGKKVMLSNDLADLCHVESRRLNEQVIRNTGRFPEFLCFN